MNCPKCNENMVSSIGKIEAWNPNWVWVCKPCEAING